MENTNETPPRNVRFHGAWGLAALGLTLGLALVLSARIISATIIRVKSDNQSIEINGFAEKSIVSDWASWDCVYGARGATLAQASTSLETAREAVLAYLKSKGANAESLDVSPMSVRPVFGSDATGQPKLDASYYALSQRIRISTGDIDLVAKAAQDSAELVKQGVELSAAPPEYYYTKWGDLKITMLGQAAADARRRADELVRASGGKVGALRYVHQGVFQIVPVHSTAVSDNGMNDTASKDKTIKATVTARYSID